MSDVIGILKTLCPTITSALLGPLSGIAVSALGNIIGIDAPTQKNVADAFRNGQLTGEQIQQLQELEMQYKEQELERGFKYAELEFKNVDGARQMQIATHSTTPAVLSYLVTVGFFGILIAMIYFPDQKASEPLLILLGALGAAFGAVVNFWLGSSHGSEVKSDLLAYKK